MIGDKDVTANLAVKDFKFGDIDAVAMVAVKNLEVAGKFYRTTLGLTQIDAEGDEVLVFTSGHTKIDVYRSQYAGTNKATALTWPVGENIEGVVSALKAKGITFEHYDLPDTTREGDIHVSGDVKVAWFKDPDGNILSIVNR
jgi:catechol 2,3-dioxygenase-like lactoylglutathione lyase family enzyme